MTDLEAFIKHMSIQQPSWPIDFAKEHDMQEFARDVIGSLPLKAWMKGRPNDEIVHRIMIFYERLQQNVARRLYACANATYHMLSEAGEINESPRPIKGFGFQSADRGSAIGNKDVE